ncbi:putative FY-rich, FY-rich, WD40/YVTN repeat-like-containing domain protein [Tanacetum coccineum]|uniref:FY-rich, FY-rich, WD40/YVTN repeat-like-containing domain protein n=1 Tax=Tanacetum coccineum TaxID=301880 RepID=A0ABQ4ZSV3_9ASTR
MQFTPDGKCLVLLNNIKASYCREGSVDCQCSVCTSDSLEKNAVKVMQVKLGYVQVVCKLKTTNDVGSILVCEPSYLVAAEEGGRINLWTMNSQWSAPIDKCYLPTSDSKSNCIVRLKRIPNFPDLIVGHSAFGDFYLWDLSEGSYKDSESVLWMRSLVLLAKSKLVSENALDPSATVAGASDATMSCLTADDSDSGAFAVAVDGSQLQVYALDTISR